MNARRIIRYLHYVGSDSWLRTVLERSMPDGTLRFSENGSITVSTDRSTEIPSEIVVGSLRTARPELDAIQADRAKVRELVNRLETFYQFECPGGPLRNCIEWVVLRRELGMEQS